MKGWLGRIGGGGLAAIAALSIAAAAIGYRLVGAGETSADTTAQSGDPLTDLERLAEADPDNAGAWQELGYAYFELGRFRDAAEAYERATAADPDSAVLWSSLGESLVMASERDPMPRQALQAFRRAIALDREEPRARYFLAVEKDLAEDHEGAIADWLALLADTPPDAPWEADLRRTIEQVAAINRIDVDERMATALADRPDAPPAMAAIPGPTQEQLAEAASLRPAEQQQMAESMVARLAARLESEPGDVEGWIMLMRSYQTLRRTAEARAALASAVAANPGARTRLETAAQALGIS